MDPVTQGALGAAASQAVFGKRLGRWSLPIGWASGMLADVDVFVPGAADPLFAWTFHRSVTHSLVFIPIGAFLAALPFLAARSLRERWRELYTASFLGYATHALLDACTTYGTLLMWPFSDVRVSWDVISIVDPIYTLLLIAGVVWSAARRSPRPAWLGLACASAYMALCAFQHARAVEVQERVVATRGHHASAARVLPTLGQNVLFRSIYRTPEGVMVVDALRVPLIGAPTLRAGGRLDVFDPADEKLAERAVDPGRMRRDLARFAWFTDGYWARTPAEPALVGDMRFAGDTAGLDPLWGIVIDPADPVPVRAAEGRGERFLDASALWREIAGRDPRHVPVP
jgi:inner membrane protein